MQELKRKLHEILITIREEIMKVRSSRMVALFVLSLFLSITLGICGADAAGIGAQLAGDFLKKTPVAALPDPPMTMEQASKAQEEFIGVIAREFGEPVGYKAGLTNPNVQKAFGVSEPVRGTMLNKMMLPSGATLPAKFGAVPVFEGDLIVRVGDEAINGATSAAETLKSLDAVIPFTELPDMVFAKGVKLTGAAIAAINVGARYGVMGTPIPLAATPEWMARLKNFSIQMLDEKGAVVGEGKGAALLGDPLTVVFWIKNSLAAQGKKLKKGDLLSLGSLTRPTPPRPGMTVRSIYTGLDPKGPVEISVSFK
jgi:2-keto-4-pentenoate hydratase